MVKMKLAILRFLLLFLPEVIFALSASSLSSGAGSASVRRLEPGRDEAASGLANFLGKVSRHDGADALVAISSAFDATSAATKLTLGNVVGNGASGEVFLANIGSCRASSSFVVKIQKTSASTPLENRCDREVEALGKVKNFPDFVHILGHSFFGDPVKGSVCAIAMQKADTDLGRWKPSNATSPSNRDIAIQLASAMKRLHEAGFAHRDIKPSNVFLLNAPGHILIGDLAFLCNLNEAVGSKLDTCGSVHRGDPKYYPPEYSMTSMAKDEEAHDLWSLGITMCLGFSENPAEIMKQSEPQHSDAFDVFKSNVLAKETDAAEKQSKKFRFALGMKCMQEARHLDDREIGELLALLLSLNPEDRKSGFKAWTEKKEADIRQDVDKLQLDLELIDQTECLAKETDWAAQLHQEKG